MCFKIDCFKPKPQNKNPGINTKTENINLISSIPLKTRDSYSADKCVSGNPKLNITPIEQLCLCAKYDETKLQNLFINNNCRLCGRNKFEVKQHSVTKQIPIASTISSSNKKISKEASKTISREYTQNNFHPTSKHKEGIQPSKNTSTNVKSQGLRINKINVVASHAPKRNKYQDLIKNVKNAK